MSWASHLPAAISALATISASATGVSVRTGPMVTASAAREEITIGFVDDEQGQPAATGAFEFSDYARTSGKETFTVSCVIRRLDGASSSVVANVQRCFDLLAIIGVAIENDKTLGGAVASSYLGQYTLQPVQMSKGLLTSLSFAVECTAFA